jgi:NADH-quinone oxidoreductase subunit E
MPEIALQSPPSSAALYLRRKADIDKLAAKYPTKMSMLLPILWMIQEEDGWISPDSMLEAAAICEVSHAQVMEVVSFYVMYNRKPVGKYVLGICATLPCALRGSDGLYDYVSEKLGIGWSETDAEGMFTIQRRECLGACDVAPVMLVNQKIEINLTRARVDEIISECKSGKRKPYFTGRNG